MKKLLKVASTLVAVFAIAILPGTYASAVNTDVTQVINNGTLSSAILNESRAVVASPTFAMTATNFSFDCQAATGSLGSAAQRLYVINASSTAAASAAFSMSIAGTGSWADGGTNTYAYNAPPLG